MLKFSKHFLFIIYYNVLGSGFLGLLRYFACEVFCKLLCTLFCTRSILYVCHFVYNFLPLLAHNKIKQTKTWRFIKNYQGQFLGKTGKVRLRDISTTYSRKNGFPAATKKILLINESKISLYFKYGIWPL